MSKEKYTKEFLEEIVRNSKNISDVLRNLQLKVVGCSHNHIKKKIEEFKIDVSHFKSYGYTKGKTSGHKKHWTHYLRIEDRDYRQHGHLLRRALVESGVDYKCLVCDNNGNWNKDFLILEVDHINQNFQDNRKENLRFLCPNCHSQNTDKQKKNNRKLRT